jgi:hypothetical protein
MDGLINASYPYSNLPPIAYVLRCLAEAFGPESAFSTHGVRAVMDGRVADLAPYKGKGWSTEVQVCVVLR